MTDGMKSTDVPLSPWVVVFKKIADSVMRGCTALLLSHTAVTRTAKEVKTDK